MEFQWVSFWRFVLQVLRYGLSENGAFQLMTWSCWQRKNSHDHPADFGILNVVSYKHIYNINQTKSPNIKTHTHTDTHTHFAGPHIQQNHVEHLGFQRSPFGHIPIRSYHVGKAAVEGVYGRSAYLAYLFGQPWQWTCCVHWDLACLFRAASFTDCTWCRLNTLTR